MAARDDDLPPREPGDVALELQRILLGAEGIEAFLADAARYAAGEVEHAHSAGITVGATRWSRMLGATTDPFAEAMDGIQYVVDDGPCLTCLRTATVVTATVVTVDDITGDSRWPAFARRGRQAGAGSSVSVPLRINGDAVGALNLYSKQTHGLTDADRVRAQQFADHAAGALAQLLQEREQTAAHLERALRSRSVIDQALGVIMARAGVDADRAFGLLRSESQHSNDKLRDVAARIVGQASRRAI
jgi:GAF domain-containing protein